MALRFRLAESRDVGAIVGLVDSAYRGDASRAGWTTEADLLDGQRTDPEAVSAIVDARASAMLVAEAGGQLAGCCQPERRPGGDVYFGMFAVRPGSPSASPRGHPDRRPGGCRVRPVLARFRS